MQNFSLSDYTYTLPDTLIAQEACDPAHDARCMVIDREKGTIDTEGTFMDLTDILTEDDILFFNDSRVVKSRIRLKNIGYTTTLGHTGIIEDGEIFFLNRRDDTTFEALVRPGNKLKKGTYFTLGNAELTILDSTLDGRLIEIQGQSIYAIMEQYGELPLPPYIEYTKEKEKDYQTAFAKKDGSVAAPTASLHFTRELLDKLKARKEYVTLHVGLGTFKGIDTDDVRAYDIHRETLEIRRNLFETIATYKHKGKNIIAVGTTACRTLESMSYIWVNLAEEDRKKYSHLAQTFWDRESEGRSPEIIQDLKIETDSIYASTAIYIFPGYHFSVIDSLITNFHLPKSSLLVLVSSFLGHGTTMKIYQYAIEKSYRFFSFGDGMYIRKK